MSRRQFAVIGLGNFGYYMAQTLSQAGCDVLAIDTDGEKIQMVSEFVAQAVQCDATDQKALREAGVPDMDVAVVSVGDDLEASILIVMALRELGLKEIVAKAISPIHGKILRNLGVKRVVYPEQESAVRVAHSLITPNLLEYLELAPGYSLTEIPLPHFLEGKSLSEARLRTLYGVNVIAVKKTSAQGQETLNLTPSPEDKLSPGDVLIIIGKDQDLQRLGELK